MVYVYKHIILIKKLEYISLPRNIRQKSLSYLRHFIFFTILKNLECQRKNKRTSQVIICAHHTSKEKQSNEHNLYIIFTCFRQGLVKKI